MSKDILWLFFPLAVSLHNLEEAIWFPIWSKTAKNFVKSVEKNQFSFALILVSILAYLSTFFALANPNSWFWTHLFHGFLGAMIVNTIMPHLASTIILRKYSPGLVTSLFLLVPINSVILVNSVNLGIIQILDLLLSGFFVSLILLSLLPLFFKFGKFILDQSDI